ncbi:hypothetical protein LTR85_005920 [Meristemomyces frigidus]|nr:hypothetical protein LTR85_005920 [Meristemomyces frigidus]
MTATDGDDASDYQHWADDDDHMSHPATVARGYDSHNGLHYHTYHPSQQKPPSPAAPKTQPYPRPQVIYQYAQQPQMMAAYPPMQYTYAQPGAFAYPAPAYYGYPQPAMPQPQPVYQPARVEAEKLAKLKANKWQGRSKAEVEEDNMKIASKEGAYDKRKVVPQVNDDQMMWVVETDGSHTLRTFVNTKELKGEWKKDPRYEDSYYFVRDEEKD